MLIIDTNAEDLLMKQLQRLRDDAEGWRSLHLHVESLPRTDLLEHIEQFAAACAGQDTQAYFLHAGDVLLLMRNVAVRSIRQASLAFNGQHQKILFDPLVDLLELSYGWARVMALVGDRQERLAEAARQSIEQSRARELAQTRQMILNLPVDPQLIRTLDERRERHERPVIMVVEDEPFSARLVEGVLSSTYTVQLASDGQSAILNYARWAPHVLFLDIDLPDVSGYDVLHRIRAMDPDVYVVMLSSHADRQHILQSRELGAQGFVGKPFTKDKLGQYIQRCPLIKTSSDRRSS